MGLVLGLLIRSQEKRPSPRNEELTSTSSSRSEPSSDTSPRNEELTSTSSSRSEPSSDTSSRNAIYDLSDTVCIIYTYLEPRDQGSLRQTCLTAAERFDQTVDMGYVPAAGSMDIAAWESRRQTAYDRDQELLGSSIGSRNRWQWFPVARRYSAWRSIEVLQVNVDAIALNPTFRTEWGIEMTSNGTAVASDNFLANLRAVRRVCFRESKLLEVIGDCFLRYCFQLLAVDFHGLGALTTVGSSWLCGCTSLRKISFGGLAALTTVGCLWLSGCISLTRIRFGGLGALSIVGYRWLLGCTSLTTISFEGLSALTTVDDDWLYLCPSLTTISYDSSSLSSTFLQKLKDLKKKESFRPTCCERPVDSEDLL